ncbi:MAG: hypothetical protein JNL19_02055 [Burkholderiales bacterium]|nr:hypothetical protein [Burkholderiales bacterium]
MQQNTGQDADAAPATSVGGESSDFAARQGASPVGTQRTAVWRRWTGHGIRLTFWTTLTASLLFAGVIALARFWLIPNADDFRPRVVQELSRLTGQRVVIDGFQAGWNGWSPELKMTRLQILDPRGRTMLQLPEVDTTISWRSLFFFEPRLSALTIRAPRVVVRRTAANALTVAGIDLDVSAQSEGDTGIVEWLLRQRLVQIAGGELEWQDEWRKLPPLRLRNVNVRLQNSGTRHQIGMTATPPSELASPLDLRSEFSGSDLRRIADWDGLAYLRTDYANLGLLTRYFPLPVQIAQGEGGIRAWFEFEDGQPVAVTTDLVVKNARLQLPAGAPVSVVAAPSGAAPAQAALEPLDLAALSGRLSWREKTVGGRSTGSPLTQQRWSLRDVTATTRAGQRSPASSGELLLDLRSGQPVGGSLRTAQADLTAATALLKSLPLPEVFAARWQALQPTGRLNNIDVRWRDESMPGQASPPLGAIVVEGKVDLDAVGWRAQGSAPGVTGLSGTLSGNSREGHFLLTSGSNPSSAAPTAKVGGKPGAPAVVPPLVLDFAGVFEAPLRFDRARGRLAWKRSVGSDGTAALHIDATDIDVENADAAARLSGTWESDRLGPGLANFTGTLSRAETTAVPRYLPMHMHPSTRQYLKNAIVAGTARNGKFIVKGPLWHFPFHNDEHGVFEIDAQVTGGIFDYADHWPRAESINTRLTFRGTSMTGRVAGAVMAGTPIAATEVRINDMSGSPPVLDIKGAAVGPLDAMLRWAAESPVNGWLDGFLQNAHGTGNARLILALTMPLDHPEKTQLNGEIVLNGNHVALGGDIPPMDAVNGRVRFTQNEVRVNDLAAEALGGPLRLSVGTEAGRIRTRASGVANFDRVRGQFSYPLLDQLAGTVQWTLDMSNGGRSGAADSALQIAMTTVQPRWPLDAMIQVGSVPRDPAGVIKASITRTQLDRGRDRVELDVPGQLHSILERSAPGAAGVRTVERAVIDLGAQKTALPARGYSLRGDVHRIDADATIALFGSPSASGHRAVGGLNSDSQSADFVNVSLRADEAVLYGHRFNDVTLRAQPSGQRWRLALRSREATGAIALDMAPDSGAVDAVAIRLQRLSIPQAIPVASSAMTTPGAPTAASARWPKLDLVADSFLSDGRDLGKLEVRAQPTRDDWQIDQVKLASADGTIEAKGRWRTRSQGAVGGAGATEVDVNLHWGDAGRFMARFGLPKGVERGGGSLTGSLSWPGSPAQFAYGKLGGKFSLETTGGRFTEMEPGLAKLLGVLSLQSLPRRLSFNFEDLFGKGYAFDDIRADVAVAGGIARTDGFTINGPSARVQLRGSADLNAETQDLQVRVYPSLSTATAIGIGLATANPAIGAAALLGQKLARDPIERMLMQEFEVKGTWAKPEVRQTRGTDAARAAGAGEGAAPVRGTTETPAAP